MTAKQMLKMGGFPDTEQGRAAFYKKYPTEDAFMNKYAKGGSLAFPQAPTSDQIFNMGMPATFPGPFYATGGSHMPLVHYQTAGQVDPQAMQAMMDNQGGNIPFATRQPGGPPVEQLPRFEGGGMDPKAMAEQILAIKEEYSTLTPRELKKELENIQEAIAGGYGEDPSLVMKQTVIAELLGQEMPMAQTGGIAFPQQPDPSQFFTGAHFNNEYRKGGAPCYKCGGMYDTGGNTPFNYGYFPMSMAVGGDVGLDTSDNTDYLSYAPGGEAPQGFSMQDLRNNSINQFKGFLSNTANAYNAGQVMQQGQMGMPELPQNNMGGYDANYNMNYGSQYDTDSFSSVNPNAMNNISNYQNAIDSYTIPGAGNNLMGSVFDLMATKHLQKQNQADKQNATDKARYGRFLPKHQTQGTTTGATNTGAAGSSPTLTADQIAWITEQMKNKSQNNQGNQQQGMYNPYTGQYVNAGYNFMGAPVGSRYKIKIKGHGTMPFPNAGGAGTQGSGTQGTTTQGQGAGAGVPAGMNPNDFSKYMEAMNKAGYKGQMTQKMGLLGRWLGPKKTTFNWSFGNPASQQGSAQQAAANKPAVQGPAINPQQSLMNPSSTIIPNIPATQYPATQYNSGVDQMREKFADESGVDINTMRRGGSNNDDVVWLTEKEIQQFEAGGGVLQYLDGGEFKQYY